MGNSHVQVSRRQFLVGAGALAAGAALSGCAAPTQSGSGNSSTDAGSIEWSTEAEVVVVGCGAAGWAAAHEAAAAGCKVIVIEKNQNIGGDMSICAGILPGYETPYTESVGVTAKAEDVWQEYVDRGVNPHGLPPQDVVEYVFKNCSPNIDFLADAGVEWKRIEVQAHYSKHDIFFEAHYGDVSGGGAFVGPMQNDLEASGVELMTKTRGVKLIAGEDGRVIGIQADQDGTAMNIKATRGVILTTGGYSGNSKMIAAFAEQWPGVAGCGTKTNIGDGLIMAMGLGAVTVRTQDGGFLLANSEYGTGANVNADLFYRGFICDQSGKRVINDGASYATNDLVNEFQAQFARQDEDYLWFVVDSSEDTIQWYDNNNKVHGTSFISADTLEDLAAQMGADTTTLVAAAADFSAMAGQLEDSTFGVRTSNYPIHVVENGPFHALKIGPSIVMTTGGLKANLESRALRMKAVGTVDNVAPEDDTELLEPIPGLFAAGMIAEWTCFTGWSVTSCFTLGKLAGQTAAVEEPWE